jgi:hypothetical protein
MLQFEASGACQRRRPQSFMDCSFVSFMKTILPQSFDIPFHLTHLRDAGHFTYTPLRTRLRLPFL